MLSNLRHQKPDENRALKLNADNFSLRRSCKEIKSITTGLRHIAIKQKEQFWNFFLNKK